ncbi:MAG: T9SS type A sorting domain-containing protein [Bacteroidota bacterium]|nr:T9SS type A sorting domain-containing protein [Bacteroidota bacterium]
MDFIRLTKNLFALLTLFCFVQFSFSGDQKNVKSLIISSNKIKTILYNTGSISYPGVQGNVLDLTWNGLGYGYEFGFLVGAKVPSALNPLDSLNIIIDGFGGSNKSTADGDFAPDGIIKWGWLPTDQFTNSSTKDIANNQNPASWHPTWSHWQGKFGEPIADMELVYEVDDATDAEFSYYPFPNDSLHRGLGLKMEVRYYQFSHPNIEDVLYTFYTITNVSDKPLTKMVSGMFGDPHIGGPSDYADDANGFNKGRNILYSWDPDNISGIPNLSPGYFGMMMCKTPNEKGVTSYRAMAFGGANRPKNDNLMYNCLVEGNYDTTYLYSTNQNIVGDFVTMLGTGFYSLNPNQSEEIGIAYLFAPELPSLLERADITMREYKLRFSLKGDPITITLPSAGDKIQTASVQIKWNTQTLDNDTSVSLYYSNTGNEGWKLIATAVPNSGTYSWDISSLPDGIFYKIHILNQKNESLSYDSTNGNFTIDKPGDASPEIYLTNPKNIYSVSKTIPIQWIAGDAEGDPVTIKIYFSDNDGSSYSLLDQVANTGSYSFDTKKVANTPLAKLKLEAAANGKSSFVETKTFRITNFFFALTDTTTHKHLSGSGTGMVFPGIADSTALTGNTYQVLFDSLNGSLRYNLKDLTTNQIKLTEEPLTAITGSGTLVDGLRIWFRNDRLGLDTAHSGFASTVNNISATLQNPTVGTIFYTPIDLKVEFGSMDTTITGDYITPLDSAGTNSPTTKNVKLPFKVSIIGDSTSLQLLVRDSPATGKKLRWDIGEEIIILTPPQFRISSNNAHAGIIFKPVNVLNSYSLPKGTIYYARTTRSFTSNDVFEFTADAKFGKPTLISKNEQTPREFSLEQNYPNPFNPETKIQFSLAHPGQTTLRIFDAIGREVQTLIDEELPQGVYSEVWNGKNKFNQAVASGVYFYRLQSGFFTQTKKMLLLR